MQARGLSGQDVANALAAQNLITPVGTQKIGSFEYTIQLNNAPSVIAELGDLPIKSVNGAMVYIRDVAHVRDGNPPQTNIVHVDGNRSVLMQVLKNGSVSTLAIIDGIKEQGRAAQGDPAGQSQHRADRRPVAVRQRRGQRRHPRGRDRRGADQPDDPDLPRQLALDRHHRDLDPALGARLDRDRCAALGETLNIMTLGGLALAVGILVDDATVTIENINWHLEQGKEVETAIMDGAAQIVTPAFVSLLCICIVFVPMFFLHGRRALPVRADGRSGDVRDGLLVHPVAHAGADDGELPAAQARAHTDMHGSTARCRRRAIRWCGSSAASRRASSASASAIASC